MASRATLKLNVPAQKLEGLSFCGSDVGALAEWVHNLPLANVGEASKQLYRAIVEVNQLMVDMGTRLDMLEQLRPAIHFTCAALGRLYLNQPVLLPEKARKIANLAQALQNHLAVGYKIVVADGIRNKVDTGTVKDDETDGHLMAVAIHRAIADLTKTLLRSCQLYTNPPDRMWLEMHQLFLFSEVKGIAGFRTEDTENQLVLEPSIRENWLRALLIGCSKPNQLRQQELGRLGNVLEDWARHVRLAEGDDPDALFMVDLMQDAPARYRALVLNNGMPPDLARGLDTVVLVEGLEAHLEGRDPGRVVIPDSISLELVRHAVQSFGVLTKRNFSRAPSTGTIEICVGLSATHYYVADRQEFSRLIRGGVSALQEEDRNPFLDHLDAPSERGDDVWSGAFDVGSARMPVNPEISDPDRILRAMQDSAQEARVAADAGGKEPDYPSFATEMMDTSPGGYCIRWPQTVPGNLQTGELIGVRENRDHHWSIALIRWLRRAGDQGTLMGVELVSPRAVPVGARVLQKKGGPTDWMRALMLPELKAIGQPATLITPRLPFQPNQKVHLNQGGVESKAQLRSRISGTDSISQFEFRLLETGTDEGDGGFDAVWSII